MMGSNSSKNNRRAMIALLLCSGFISVNPLAALASESADAVSSVYQQKSVNGVVKDAKGEAVIGANIKDLNNPTNGTITDFDGNFHLVVSKATKLEISFIGYKTVVVEAVPGKPTTTTSSIISVSS